MKKTILNPAATRALVPQLGTSRKPDAWVYRYDGPHGWRLSIATHAEPGSQKLSLGGFRIAPLAKVDDGLLDVCFVHKTSLPRLLALMPKVFSGKHTNAKEVEYFQCERMRIVTESPMDVYADGEYICPTPITVTLAPRALKVLRP